MRLLDLFCCAGVGAEGYAAAGFEVVGVDKNPQSRYPYKFFQADALDVLAEGGVCDDGKWPLYISDFDAIHASPPCQVFTAYQRTGNVGEYEDLIAPTRELLKDTGLPYIIENVVGAPLENPVTLCGSMFDLDVQRHRFFETNWPLEPPTWGCRHKIWAPDRYPGGRSKQRTGSSRGLVRSTVEIGTWDIPLKTQLRAMGMDENREIQVHELSEGIPPAYTEFIGEQLMAYLRREAA